MKFLITILMFALFSSLISCSSIKPIYTENWNGVYTLREFNCCGDTPTKVKLQLWKVNSELYGWNMILDKHTDTIIGNAIYEKNQMKFYVENAAAVKEYFVEHLINDAQVFKIVYSGQYYTSWYNELKEYRRGKMLFAGIDYHFRK